MIFSIDILEQLDNNHGAGYRLSISKTESKNNRSKAISYFKVAIDNDYEKSIRHYIKSKGLRTNKWYPICISDIGVKSLKKDIKNLGRKDKTILSSLYRRLFKNT